MNLLEEFLQSVKSERRLSLNTQSAYFTDLKKYLEFLQLKNVSPENVERENIQEYIMERRNLKMSSATIAREVSTIRAFHRFLSLDGYTEKDPSELIQTPKLMQRIPYVVSEKQMDMLLAIIPRKRESGFRLRAMVELLYATGLRVSELLSIQMVDINFEWNCIKVMGKGRKERGVIFGESAKTAILQYLERRKDKESNFLFPSKLGTPMSRQEFWRQLHTLARESGVSDTVSPHTLRHSFATHLMNHGMSLMGIKELLGHASLTTVQIYTKVSPEHLKESHEKFHPRGTSPIYEKSKTLYSA